MIVPTIIALYQRYKEAKVDEKLSIALFGYYSTGEVVEHSQHKPSANLFPDHLRWHNCIKTEMLTYRIGSEIYSLIHPFRTRNLELIV